jgi:GR25 family glycosyltransferase involved in LPS biosynthesis
MEMDITFCTFYFDIDRKNWKHFTVSNEMYMNWFDNLLSLDINLYILTETKFVERILKTRKKVDPTLKRTIIKETTIEDLTAHKLYNSKLENLMFSDKFKEAIYHKDVPEMCKPLYNVLMFNKVHYLSEVLEDNPFNTEYFSWVDAGFIRSEEDIQGIKIWPDPKKLAMQKNKIKFFCINPNVVTDLKKDVKSVKDHLLSQMRFLKGTIFFLHKDLIYPLKEKFDFYVNDSINKEFIGSDEKIFDLCCSNNPEMFDLYQCHWREEIKLFSHNYKAPEKIEYTVMVEWTEKDIEKSDDYQYWFFCIEDKHSKSLFRQDIQVNSEETYQKYKNYKNIYKVYSDKKPENFVVWPFSTSKGFLKAVKKPVKHIPTKKINKTGVDVSEFYFVNLDRRADRLEYIKSEIGKSKILSEKIKRWVGVDGRNVHPSVFPESLLSKRAFNDIMSGKPVVRGLSVTPGGLGFYLTHTKIFEHTKAINKNVFVMDDDIIINENFDTEFPKILEELPKDFDFCYLGYYDTPYEKIPVSEKLFKPLGQFCGPHGYIISPKGAEKILKLIYPIDIQLDSRLYQIQSSIDYYAVYDRLAMYLDKYETDIQHETGCVRNY